MATPTTLPAAFTAGQVLTAAQQNALRGAFRVLQVVSAETNTAVSSSSATYADTTLTATITPSSTSSKVLVIYHQNGIFKSDQNSGNRIDVRLFRGATILQTSADILFTNSLLTFHGPTISGIVLDSPATTSATIYKTQFRNPAAAASVSVQVNSTSNSGITLMEISA